jgi:hypothetical protein
LDTPTAFNNDGQCSAPRLGYQIDNSILALTGQTALVQVALKGLIVVLILHPICAGLCLISLLCAVVSWSHTFAICALVWTVAAAILATVSAAADLVLVRVAKAKIDDVMGLSFEILWGNAPWMSVVAVVLLWIVIVLQSATLCGCCGVSRRLWTRYVLRSLFDSSTPDVFIQSTDDKEEAKEDRRDEKTKVTVQEVQ